MTAETEQVQHTPGPWRVSTRYEDSWNVLDSNGFGLDDAPTSILDGWPDLGYEHWGSAPGVTYIERSIAERKANARLIAAAPLTPHDCDDPQCPGAENKRKLDAFPLMLEALEKVLAHVEDMDIQRAGDGWQCTLCNTYRNEIIRPAIRAATGEDA